MGDCCANGGAWLVSCIAHAACAPGPGTVCEGDVAHAHTRMKVWPRMTAALIIVPGRDS